MRSSDSGQAAFATMGFVVILVAIVGFAVDVGGVLMVQQRLKGAADAAALGAATAIDARWVAGDSGVPLEQTAAYDHADETLRRLGFDGEVEDMAVGPTSVTVRLATVHRPALLAIFGMDEFRVTAESTAVVRIHR